MFFLYFSKLSDNFSNFFHSFRYFFFLFSQKFFDFFDFSIFNRRETCRVQVKSTGEVLEVVGGDVIKTNNKKNKS